MVVNKRLILVCMVFLFAIWSCKRDDSSTIKEKEINSETLSKIEISDQENFFKDADGNRFFPWGFNYTNPQKIGLIEDNWEKESTWKIIEQDFSEMKTYSANIVRVHLQFHQFMIDVETPNELQLKRLQRLVKIAEDSQLYLDITGLAAYRKSDAPNWYDNLSDSERWIAQANFWKSIAKSVGNSEAVFAYNLMNEPVVAVGCDDILPCDWLPGEGFGGFNFVQNIARNPDLTFDIAIKDWIGQLSSAIRLEDSNTMITVGFLGLGSIAGYTQDLDYLSMHLYPKSGELQQSVDRVLNSQSDSPFVLEEISNLHCTVLELETFLSQINGKYDGLMGHYFGKTLEEMRTSVTIADALHKNFLEFFIANNPN